MAAPYIIIQGRKKRGNAPALIDKISFKDYYRKAMFL